MVPHTFYYKLFVDTNQDVSLKSLVWLSWQSRLWEDSHPSTQPEHL